MSLMAHPRTAWPSTATAVLVLLAFQPRVASSRSAQVDIIFPVEGAVYQPIYPFPIVFHMTNTSAVWGYDLFFSWELFDRNDGSSWGRGGISGSRTVARARSPSLPDSFLFINSTSEIVNLRGNSTGLNSADGRPGAGHRQLVLAYDFGVGGNCSTDRPPTEIFTTAGVTRTVWFNISSDAGEVPRVIGGIPKLTSRPSGNITAAVISVIGERLPEEWAVTEHKGRWPRDPDPQSLPCAIVQDPPPAPVQQPFRLDGDAGQDVVRQVEEAMLAAASCPTTAGAKQRWPDPTGLVQPCPRNGSGHSVAFHHTGLLWAVVCWLGVYWNT